MPTKKSPSRRHQQSKSLSPWRYLASYTQFLGAVVVGVLLTGGLIWGLLHLNRLGEEQSVTISEEKITNILVGEIYFSPTQIADPSVSLQNLLNEPGSFQTLQAVGKGGIFSPNTVVTAAHILAVDENSGYYYFYNDQVLWQQLGDWEIYHERDIAFGKIQDLKSRQVPLVNLQVAEQVTGGERLWTVNPTNTNLPQSTMLVLNSEKEIVLQQTWGEIRVPTMEVIEARAMNNLGDSGSPVFNVTGELVGVIVGVDLSDESISYISRL